MASLRDLPADDLAALWRDAEPRERVWLAGRIWRELEARPAQLEPEAEWHVWLLLGGRGTGKTKSGAECVTDRVLTGRSKRVALIERTPSDARETMVEGDTGLLAAAGPYFRPRYEPAKKRITWPNGAKARIFTAAHAEEVRGFNSDLVWGEELCAWKAPETWANAMLGLRLGAAQAIVTTTPKPTPLLREIMAAEGTVVSRMRTEENRANLADAFFRYVVEPLIGTRMGRQELDAELLVDAAGALWKRDQIERDRVKPADCPELSEVVVAIDPATTSKPGSDETGIVAAGRTAREGRIPPHGYTLADRSGRHTPEAWAREAIALYHELEADFIVAEANNGGDLVRTVIRQTPGGESIPIRLVYASRGKRTRAEPVAALAEQGRDHHAGVFPTLEDQLCLWEPGLTKTYSPDRLDAKVWAYAHLLPSQGFSVEQALAANEKAEARP